MDETRIWYIGPRFAVEVTGRGPMGSGRARIRGRVERAVWRGERSGAEVGAGGRVWRWRVLTEVEPEIEVRPNA